MDERTWRRPIKRPSNIPADCVPLMWEGVTFGDYWINPAGEVYKITGEYMPEHDHHTGYPRVSIIKNGKSTSLNVHNLVAYTFTPIPSKLIPAIDHIDTDKTNHDLHNLEFVGQAENTRRAYQEGKNRTSKPCAMCDDQGEIIKVYYSISEAEAEMKDSGKSTRAPLRSVALGKSRRKKAYGFKWKLIEWEEFDEWRKSHPEREDDSSIFADEYESGEDS